YLEALRRLEQALLIAPPGATKDSIDFRHSLVQIRLGDLRSDKGRDDEARGLFEKALATRQRIAAAYPQDEYYLSGLRHAEQRLKIVRSVAGVRWAVDQARDRVTNRDEMVHRLELARDL